ncbi:MULTISPECIES: DUF805 domain-containing protein [Novosphingobium]|nr:MULTISPECIES: DUF805 domain-containing protein [unclassified Novosphingobium]MPS69293.1 DUF805 domain-containing protein [Novosphingobium sp.]TCM42435.1 uncharacterized membrane protein YhaH (DUF805 family) [Novosphingobium sp. ST904]WRT91692.1 DUF805 domain-containing protein [Novosphingobium sp. RL4]
MLGSIKYNLSNLLNFRGRDARQTFWLYVLFLVVIQYLVGMVMAMPMMGGMMKGAFSAAQQGATAADMQVRLMAQMAGYMRTSMTVSSIVSVLAGLLLMAAFARRLHDSGRPGWISVLTFLLSLSSKAIVWSKMNEIVSTMRTVSPENFETAFAMQSKLVGASLLGYAAILLVIVFGVWPSSPGTNRYGPPPVRV